MRNLDVKLFYRKDTNFILQTRMEENDEQTKLGRDAILFNRSRYRKQDDDKEDKTMMMTSWKENEETETTTRIFKSRVEEK